MERKCIDNTIKEHLRWFWKYCWFMVGSESVKTLCKAQKQVHMVLVSLQELLCILIHLNWTKYTSMTWRTFAFVSMNSQEILIIEWSIQCICLLFVWWCGYLISEAGCWSQTNQLLVSIISLIEDCPILSRERSEINYNLQHDCNFAIQFLDWTKESL